MAIEKALEEMLAECSIDELLEMIQLYGDSYLELCTGGVNMELIYTQRKLEKFLKQVIEIQKER